MKTEFNLYLTIIGLAFVGIAMLTGSKHFFLIGAILSVFNLALILPSFYKMVRVVYKNNFGAFLLWISSGICILFTFVWNGAIYLGFFFLFWDFLWIFDPFKLKRFDSCNKTVTEKEQ